MNPNNSWQTLLTGALLLLVGAAFGAIAVKLSSRESPGSQGGSMTAAGQTTSNVQGSPTAFRDGVFVYLFHGNYRCPTCLKIEASTKEVLENKFADAIRSGRVVVKELNYEQPENQGYIQKYQLIAPTVVMVQVRNGQEIRFENLMDVWQLVGEPEKFAEFIESNLQKFLTEETT